jgi:hypothetical protein
MDGSAATVKELVLQGVVPVQATVTEAVTALLLVDTLLAAAFWQTESTTAEFTDTEAELDVHVAYVIVAADAGVAVNCSCGGLLVDVCALAMVST